MPTTKKELLTTVSREFTITPQMCSDLMVGAIEGGITGAWCGGIFLIKPKIKKKKKSKSSPWYANPSLFKADSKLELEILELAEEPVPFDTEPVYETHTINIEDIKEGFLILAGVAPRIFKDIEEDNADAETADCWLQCVVFKDIPYG